MKRTNFNPHNFLKFKFSISPQNENISEVMGKRLIANFFSRKYIYKEESQKINIGIEPHLNIRMYIVHTVLYTFSKVLLGRIWLTVKSFFSSWSFPLCLWP